jgi:hypothetical protein
MEMMRAKTHIRRLLVAAVLVTLPQAVAAQPPADAQPPIAVVVECFANPEFVTITNNRAKPIVVRQVSSTYRPRAGEPFKLRQRVKPGKRVIYTFGTGKGKRGKRLSRSFIFDNERASEGVLVKTDRGRVKVRCGEVTNVPLEPTPEPAAALPDDPADIVAGEPVDALALLATLPVESEVSDGYDRALFKHWVDADGDGCDTREEVLIAESLTPVTKAGSCDIESGTWFSSFDGDTITNPASMDINHTVPLEEAWQSGARHWTPERREAFANDLLDERSLRAVSAGANRDQGEADPASWLPADQAVACEFVLDWVAIKASWGLAVDQVERDVVGSTLEACPDRMTTVVARDG